MSTRMVEVRAKVLKQNDLLARALRERFRKEGTCVVSLVSSPGSGKTALLEKLLADLARDSRVAALVGDLATENDAERLRRATPNVKQITTGTVCHLDARMVARALAVFPVDQLDLLVIENVGNLICPASFDLGEGLRVVVCSVAEGAEKPRKYPVMFHKADVVLINKIDLAEASDVDLNELEANIRSVNPSAAIFKLSCKTGLGLGEWTDWLERAVTTRRVSTLVGA